MSFAFMPIYTGDYLRDTRHLTPQKHGVYILLLMHCWDQKGPLPLDEQECAGIANCRSSDEIEAIRYILNKYFVRMDDGWYNHRMQQEIERSEAISMARSSAGRKGYQAKAKQLLIKSQASATTPTPTPTTTPIPTPTKTKAPATPLPDWLDPSAWDDFLAHRKAMKSAMTPKAQTLAINELTKLKAEGHNPGEVIKQSIMRGWKGLFAINKPADQKTTAAQAWWSTEASITAEGAKYGLTPRAGENWSQFKGRIEEAKQQRLSV